MTDAPVPISFDAAGNIQLPSASDLVALLPPEAGQLAGAMQQGSQVIAGAAPAIALIDQISSGKASDPQAVIGALAGTVAMVNPVAGAIVGAAGEAIDFLQNALDSTFQSLGLISPPPKTYPFRGGIREGDPTPTGPQSPLWKTWSSFASPYAWNDSGTPSEYVWQHILSQSNVASAETAQPITDLLYALNRYGEVAGTGPDHKGYRIGPIGKNDFERFLFALLQSNLVAWWNNNASIPPRNVLMGAASLWNRLHASAPPQFRTVGLPPFSVTAQTAGDVTYSWANATQGGAGDPVAWLLSQWGDISGQGRQVDPITVHMGGRLPPPRTIAPSVAANAAGAAAAVEAKAIAAAKAKAKAHAVPTSGSSAVPWIVVGIAGLLAFFFVKGKGP